ncbi:Glutathione S-transferase S1 [Actinomortierella ambigua]|uniref:Glutathione S-transferase S1 n=1 Tax=Actinomortierella ambigua TaxID=1343610 RepID=A0A9P6TX18_9FUNG|nr:Glutathione S-transferase S1 [Actinomortierella ambigua]
MELLSYRPKDSTSAENAEQMTNSEGVSNTFVYFNFLSAGHTARAILVYMSANWTNADFPYSDDWEEKHITPLGVLPVLKIHTPKIKDIIISEAIVIDFYLAKKAGLLGNNEWEEQVIKSIYSSAHYLRERFFMRVTYIDQESKKRNFSRFMEFLLPHFIRTMEFHLQDNGANGFFMGDRLSLADIHVAAVMDHFFLQPMGEPIRKVLEASELLMKVKQSVDNEPRLASWKKTQQYKVLEEETIQFYAVSAIIEGA